ncbi:hypothetical protein DHW03_13855 [Pedobacter yonginense]|uniref:5'-Nucleotidase C-terminal domain-containing protein n=1 Tax=Pedobacter yonginense TaxID=651869 RepID=A0A317ELQ6_9SPHI|nr:5'-nucleotidase C-terminal domain-containing protein [Pedobacter yonginense]PWS27087.1 hypothetical protein DHW03_13855 [Pedobacter yonginense]
MTKKFLIRWQAIWLLPLALLISCKPHFELVKAKRKQYNVSDQVQADSAIIKTYLPYKQKMEAEMNAVIGKADSMLSKGKGPESLLSNFFADACLIEAKKIDANIDFTMPSTTGGLRNSLPKGNITLANVFELMPFENELLVLKLKGTDVQDLLQFIAQSGGQPVAGITLKINNKTATDVKINGQAFDASKTYSVLTSDYIAGGGDDTFGLQHPIEKKTLGLKVRDALINYIKTQTAEGKSITTTLDGRITKNE